MKLLLAIACFVTLAVGPAFAEHITEGPAGEPVQLPDRQDVCQYGFQDDGVGWGSTLGLGQQLGIECPAAGCISGVGFFCEFLVTPGELDIVIYDDGTEVFRYTIPTGGVVEGVNEFMFDNDIPIAGDACIMLCAVNDNNGFWSVTGEDLTNGPFANTYWSNSCQCTNEFTGQNLTIWAHLCGAVPTETTTWGSVKTLYR